MSASLFNLRNPLLISIAGFALTTMIAQLVLFPDLSRYSILTASLERIEKSSEKSGAKQQGEAELPFFSEFPSNVQLLEVLTTLDRLAQGHGLAPGRSEYRVVKIVESPLVAHDIDFFIRGSYPDIRSFLLSALSDVPQLALMELTLARTTAVDQSVEAQSRLRLYFRE
ncbi:MAG TPA: hypothetical protein VGE57_09050 [Solimonas sp.]